MKNSQYDILGLVGQGQFGKVFCAYDRLNKTIVALKVIDQRRFPTHQFLRELRFLSSLNHPNIVTWQGLKHYASQRYLIMDYCEGGTLREWMETDSINSLDSLQIIMDILSGLEHAHSRSIIHCDLKPENILLNLIPKGWIARISDFGIAKVSEEKINPDRMGDTGSPAYMAPERFYGQSYYASDLYAVGIMLYELLVGERPFSGTPRELMSAHLNQTAQIPDNIPFLLRSIITKALQKLPQHRFNSATEMLESVKMAREVEIAIQLTPIFTKEKKDIYLEDNCINLVSGVKDNLCFEVITQVSEPVISLAGNRDKIYLGLNYRILCQTKVDKWEISLQASPIKLSLSEQGCLVFTQQDNKYAIHQVSSKKLETIFTIESSHLLSTIDKKGKWLALAYCKPNPRLVILKPQQACFITHPLTLLPSQLVTLDSHHGLAVLAQDNEKTQFAFFNRRGNWYEGFNLGFRCSYLTPSATYPYHLLGIEEENRGLLIELKPLKVSRFTLPIIPQWIIPQAWGYLLANSQGEIFTISHTGQTLCHYQLVSGKIKAITAISEEQVLIAT